MRFLMILFGVLIAGCSGGNQATESGGSMSQSVKYPYPPPVQEVRTAQPNAKPPQEANQEVEKRRRKGEPIGNTRPLIRRRFRIGQGSATLNSVIKCSV